MTWPQPYDASPFAVHLQPGEQAVWSGQPDPNRVLQPSDAFAIPFSLLWGGFAIFWESTVLSMGAPIFMALFGLPFVLVGLYLIVGRFVHRAWANRRTWYVLTETRALVVYGKSGQHARSVELDRISDVSVTRRPDGSGTVVFSPSMDGLDQLPPAARRIVWNSGGTATPGWSGLQRGPLTFANIRDVATVEALADSYSRGLR